MFESYQLLIISFAYFGLIFFIAIAAEKKWLPEKITQHPIIYTLSLGAYAGTWALFGALDLAQSNGYVFLAYYFSASALFMFSPLILQPLLTLSKTYQLHSLADLMSFRYHSKWVGIFTTCGIIISALPLMAIQINMLAESAVFLSHKNIYKNFGNSGETQHLISLTFCLGVIIFSIVFGSHQITKEKRHEGLIVATAFQSLLKLIFFITLGAAAIFMVFESPQELELWLLAQPGNLQQLNESLVSNNARTLTLIFFSATLAMPHMYHLAISENPSPRAVEIAGWSFPLYMMWMALPILPILWAGQAVGLEFPAHFFALAIGHLTEIPAFSIFAFICTLAAASASLIIITVALASMSMNHLFLPFYSLSKNNNVYYFLRNIKRGFMAAVMLLAYSVYIWVSTTPDLHNFGYASFTAAFQFLPGILAVLYWPRANKTGLLAGLLAGFTVWAATILLPFFSPDALGLMPILDQLFIFTGDNYWTAAAIMSIGFNMSFFGLISRLSSSHEEERYAAMVCSQDDLSRPPIRRLTLTSIDDFSLALEDAIGQNLAQREINKAIEKLKLSQQESRPFALRLLRRQIESNLSGLFGPTVARQIVTQYLPYHPKSEHSKKTDIGLMEHRLEKNNNNLSGLASELDSLRRYHRQTIEDLPIGICSLSEDDEVLLWNKTMQELTGIHSTTSLGSQLSTLSSPWSETLQTLLDAPEEHLHKEPLVINSQTRWFTLHKTGLQAQHASHNKTILLEEVTSTALLEQEVLHSERLASIGRLAAGVAHEIGNPVTGIACLAQNLKYDSDVPAIHDAAKDILEQTQRITRIVQSLVTFSHAGAHGKNQLHEIVDCYLCADDAVHLLSLEQKQLGENVVNDINPEHTINGDAQRILQVFINLIKNALDASGDDVKIHLQSMMLDSYIEISITDNGPGIAADIQEQIFDPFFTTKDPGEGTGLGLSVVYSIIEEHRGHIELISPTDTLTQRGCCFKLQLPKHSNTSAAL